MKKNYPIIRFTVGRFSLSVLESSGKEYRATITDTFSAKKKINFFDTESGAIRWFVYIIADRTNESGEQKALHEQIKAA